MLGPNSRMGAAMGGAGAKGWRDAGKRPQDSRRDAGPAGRPGTSAPAAPKGNLFAALSDISDKSPVVRTAIAPSLSGPYRSHAITSRNLAKAAGLPHVTGVDRKRTGNLRLGTHVLKRLNPDYHHDHQRKRMKLLLVLSIPILRHISCPTSL